MLPRAVPALLACSVTLACTVTTAQIDDNEPKPSSSGAIEAADEAGPEPEDDEAKDEAKPARATPPGSVLPDCPSGDGTFAVYCTEDDKLAGQWLAVDTLKIPDDVEIIFNVDGPDASAQTSLLIATRGEELYIKHVTCGACRRVLGRGFVGQLAHLSEAQLREVQTQLGLDADTPALATAEQWKSFCSDELGKAALTKIAETTEGGGGR